MRDTISFSTVGLSGWNTLEMEVNPYINGSLSIKDQPEQEHFNNLLSIPFFVTKDDENPILDVTFDGIHIIDGEVVSSKPMINITLDDENPYLIMEFSIDTKIILISIKKYEKKFKQEKVPDEFEFKKN